MPYIQLEITDAISVGWFATLLSVGILLFWIAKLVRLYFRKD